MSCFVQFIFLELYAVYNFISLICHQFIKNVSKIIPQGYIVLAIECDEPKPLDELLVCATSAGFFFDATSVVKTMTAPMPMLLLCFKL